MKRISSLTLIAIILAAGSLSASSLRLTVYDGAVFHVQFDKKLLPEPTRELTITNVEGGNHFLVVFRHENGANGNVVRKVFSGIIRVPEGTDVISEIDSRSRYRVIHQQVTYPAPAGLFVISPRKFIKIQRKMERTPDDGARLRIARRGIRNNVITSTQAHILISMLAFEKNRVKLAKYAYPRIADKGNFRTVYNLFYEYSSIRKIERAIRNYHI